MQLDGGGANKSALLTWRDPPQSQKKIKEATPKTVKISHKDDEAENDAPGNLIINQPGL